MLTQELKVCWARILVTSVQCRRQEIRSASKCGFFLFEGENLVCERIYFDTFSMIKQLIKGFDLKSPAGIYRSYKNIASLTTNLKDLIKG